MASPKDAPPPSPDLTKTAEAPAQLGASSSPDSAVVPDQPATGLLDPGVYEYTAPYSTVYPVPLTAHPLIPAVAATDGTAGGPEVPATVFDWFEGCPNDGRWTPSRKKPNQQPDNHPADTQGV